MQEFHPKIVAMITITNPEPEATYIQSLTTNSNPIAGEIVRRNP